MTTMNTSQVVSASNIAQARRRAQLAAQLETLADEVRRGNVAALAVAWKDDPGAAVCFEVVSAAASSPDA